MKSAMRAVLAAALVVCVGMPMSTSYAEAKPRAASAKAKAAKVRAARAKAIAIVRPTPIPDPGFLARDAYYSGDIQKALELAPAAGERWIAALCAWRLGRHEEALQGFAAVAADSTQDQWFRSGAAFWAARAAGAIGRADDQQHFLRTAAASPWTFYGMIAEAQLGLTPAISFAQAVASPHTLAAEAVDPLARLIRTSTGSSEMAPIPDLPGFNPAQYPVPALAPIGGFTVDPALVYALIRQESRFNPAVVSPAGAVGLMQLMPSTAALTAGDDRFRDREVLRDPAVNMRLGQDYLAKLAPIGGFTVDPALVYALIRQESRFNPAVVSPAGAVGLMQLMPATAALTAGDDRFRDREVLRDPAVNMRLGQDYLAKLASSLVGDDMLMVIAAYNGGPGAVSKTVNRVGWGADPLLMIESLPARETRDYVEKVMAGYWIYRRQFGQPTPSLDALAQGAPRISLAMDSGVAVASAPTVTLTNAVARAPVSTQDDRAVSPEPVAEIQPFKVGLAF